MVSNIWMEPLRTPVLFLVFNRPETTAQVFEAIRQAKPPRLYVAADGPRPNHEVEADLVAQVRKIATEVDWSCEVKTLFRNENLGCKYAVSGGISWFFEQEEQGIILEDDCLPSKSFFWFCEELLERYAKDERIFIISGYNKQQEWHPNHHDYFFSNLGGIWGWATWRRAWVHYDSEMKSLDEFAKLGFFESTLGYKLGNLRRNQLVEAKKQIKSGKIDTWDYQWGYSRTINKGLACVPSISLIQNIGFNDQATHTKKTKEHVIAQDIEFPLKINEVVTPDNLYDLKFIKRDGIIKKIINLLNK